MNGKIRACIFDLDGVLVDTAHLHYQSWRRLANALGFDFDEEKNELLKGVSRKNSLDIILEWGNIDMEEAEKTELMAVKNSWYQELISHMGPSDDLPGARAFIEDVHRKGYRIGLGSASKNAKTILRQIDFLKYFDAVVDGNDVTRSKPDPEVFLLGSKQLASKPAETVVLEDSLRGLEAAKSAGFVTIGVGQSSHLEIADKVIDSLEGYDASLIQSLQNINISG